MSDPDRLAEQLARTLAAYRSHHPHDEVGAAAIRAAYCLAADAHTGQLRATGQPYIIHPLAVAFTVADLGMDVDTVVAALCHDVVEDTPVTMPDLADRIGAAAAALVDGVTKLEAVAHASRAHANAANLRKLLLAATADPRVLVVKIADRLHNVTTLAPLPASKRDRVARETLEVYAPIAQRLGMNETAAALEDAAFAALQPELFAEISARMDAIAPRREEKVRRIQDAARAALAAAHLEATVTGRQKHVYSTWRKTIVRKQNLDDIADLIGVRVIVTDTATCYTALGVLHNEFTPVPGRFRDYIAQPRFGHYQSLHTTVAVEGVLTEVQIRSWAMHAAAEQGIAAHWRYKDHDGELSGPGGNERQDQLMPAAAPSLPWLQQLLESGFVSQSTPDEFLASVRHDLGAGEVVVFTPHGDPLALPEGATVLDAAYAVHTQVGHRCVEAKVNGRTVPRAQVLHPGDQFEIVTGPAAQPTAAWLDEVTTGRARAALSTLLNSQERTASRLAAVQALNVALRQAGVGRGWAQAAPLASVAPLLGYGSAESLLDSFAAHPELEQATAAKIRDLLAQDATHTLAGGPYPTTAGPAPTPTVAGHDDLVVVSADCCVPAPGQDGVGVPSAAGVVTLHAVDCLTLARTDGPLYDVTFTPDDSRIRTEVELHALHRRTLLSDVTTAVAASGADILDLAARTEANHTARVTFTACAADPDMRWRLLDTLRGVDGVYQVTDCEAARP